MNRSRQPWTACALRRRLRAVAGSLPAPAVFLRVARKAWARLQSRLERSRRAGRPATPMLFMAGAPGFEFLEESGLARLVTSLALVGVGFAFGVLARSSFEEPQESQEIQEEIEPFP